MFSREGSVRWGNEKCFYGFSIASPTKPVYDDDKQLYDVKVEWKTRASDIVPSK